MKTVTFDFDRIGTIEDFYTIAKKDLQLPEHFGGNMNALWDGITGDIELPVTILFINLSMNQLEQFEKLISLFEDAATELEDQLIFEYYLKKVV